MGCTRNEELQEKLQKFENRAARFISGASYDVRGYIDVLESLGWETLDKRRLQNKQS